MNIIEAIKSGNRFRRKGWRSWYEICNGSIRNSTQNVSGALMSEQDIVADDYEVEIEEEKIEISKQQLVDVISGVFSYPYGSKIRFLDDIERAAELLGFKS